MGRRTNTGITIKTRNTPKDTDISKDTEMGKDTDISEDMDISLKKGTVNAYEKNDLIECRSVTSGLLVAEGAKTGIVYKWADYGDIESVEYQDLIFMLRSNKATVYNPRIIILDENIVKDFPALYEVYKKMYNYKDMSDILKLPLNEMRKVINELPPGVADALKGVASKMIENGNIDSIKRMKILDDIFNTEFKTFALK